jgi:heptosyltransferase-3
MKILLIKHKNIGDVLLSTPLIKRLKEIYPAAKIDFSTNDFCTEVLSKNPDISNIYTKNIFDTLRVASNGYDLTICLSQGNGSAITACLSRATKKVGFTPKSSFLHFCLDRHIERVFPLHTAQIDLELLRLLGHEPMGAVVTSSWDNSDKAKIDEIISKNSLRKYVVLHPVSRWMFKCWRDEYFAAVIDHIQLRLGLQVVITASDEPKELDKVSNIIAQCSTTPISLAGELSLSELAYLYSRAKLFVGVDTAPMHIAASVNIPVIALFGPSEPAIWGPWDNTTNQQYEPIAKIQKTKLHTIVQNGFGEIKLDESGNKYSTALFDIEPNIVISEIEARL